MLNPHLQPSRPIPYLGGIRNKKGRDQIQYYVVEHNIGLLLRDEAVDSTMEITTLSPEWEWE